MIHLTAHFVGTQWIIWYTHLKTDEFTSLAATSQPTQTTTTKTNKKQPKDMKVRIQRVQRKGKKFVTVIAGLHLFDVKLSEASKAFRGKFSCGASIVKSACGTCDQIDVQGDVEEDIVNLIKKEYPHILAGDIIVLPNKS
eukprot:GHVR01076598.1.p1 GENE.GHVR01076598.1~~GHVR01076598.1.p1  ORF type:complete len:140 (+),score=30.78 GHVR01076598.1:226-645(+)